MVIEGMFEVPEEFNDTKKYTTGFDFTDENAGIIDLS